MKRSELTPVMYKVAQILNGYKSKKAEDDDLKAQAAKLHGVSEDDVSSAVLLMNQLGFTRLEVISNMYFVCLTTSGLREFQNHGTGGETDD